MAEASAPRIIDAHHHLWRYDPDGYGWIGDSIAVLKRDFLPRDLVSEISIAGVSGTIAVQSRQSLSET